MEEKGSSFLQNSLTVLAYTALTVTMVLLQCGYSAGVLQKLIHTERSNHVGSAIAHAAET